ncbi:MAG: NUDIX domain-containing protein, partial [Pseudomonadota bacterium]
TLDPVRYDLPHDLVPKLWKGRYRGQEQVWFLFRFTGSDADVNIDTEHPEFSAWRWLEPAELPERIVPFKRAVYETVLDRFAAHVG